MFLFIAEFFGFFAFLMVGAGFWVLLFAEKVRVSFLKRFFFLGPWLTLLKATLGLEFKNDYLRGGAKNLLGIFLIIAGLIILSGLWFVVNEGLIIR